MALFGVMVAMVVVTVVLVVRHSPTTVASFTPPGGAGPTTFLTPTATVPLGNTGTATAVTLTVGASAGKSQFLPGYSNIDQTFTTTPLTPATRLRLTQMLQGVAPIQNTFIQGWGVDDPWPDPTAPEPTNWSSLDANVAEARALGADPVLSLCEAPWWMKGVPEPDGSTKLLKQADEWSDDAYGARILDNQMSAWLHLVQRMAERYMAPPYNVRRFQVWNELKGYFNPATSTYDMSLSPGDPTGPHTQHGYTYMYNQVYATLLNVADEVHVAHSAISIGGPYVAMDSWSSTASGVPSTLVKPYGIFDQRPLDALAYWLQHKSGAGFITLSVTAANKDGVEATDPFTAAQKFGDLVTYIRKLDPTQYPGATTLPIWLAEWYASPYASTTDTHLVAAVKASALVGFIQAGGAVALQWGGLGEGTPDGGMWTNPAQPQGGTPQPWYFALKTISDAFSPNTPVFAVQSAQPNLVTGLASNHTIILINHSTRTIRATISGHQVYLSAYAVVALHR